MIPTYCLYCCRGALRALASLSFCLPVYLHGETRLPSSMLQACYMLVHRSHFIRSLVQLLVPSIGIAIHSIESFFTNSIYIRQREFTRPECFLLGNGTIALRDSLAILPWHVGESLSAEETSYTSELMQPSPGGRS